MLREQGGKGVFNGGLGEENEQSYPVQGCQPAQAAVRRALRAPAWPALPPIGSHFVLQ